MPLGNRKKRVFCFFFRERHGCASARGTGVLLSERKKTRFLDFFSFARGMVLLPPETRLCFHERHGRASFENVKKTSFLFFFFRERHGFASARGTVVL